MATNNVVGGFPGVTVAAPRFRSGREGCWGGSVLLLFSGGEVELALRHRHFARNRPDEAGQFTGNGDDHLVVRQLARHQSLEARARRYR